MALHGVYPLLFPQHGYKGQLAWLVDSAACGGEEAYSALLAAAREGEVELPRHLEVWHQSGQAVHLGPHLTTPTGYHLKTTPDLSITFRWDVLVATHSQVEKDQAKEMEWEAEVPDLEEAEDDEKDDDNKEIKDFKPTKDEPPKEAEEELRAQQQEAALKQKQLFVDYNMSDVTVAQLRKHFEQFGLVEEVLLPSTPLAPAIITFGTAAIAESLVGRSHTLQLTVGGCVPLRLRGGSGRARVPPRQQRHNTCPFR